MLAKARRVLPPEGALPGGLVMEQKSDGFRAIVFARSGCVLVHSRHGADLTPAFPQIASLVSTLITELRHPVISVETRACAAIMAFLNPSGKADSPMEPMLRPGGRRRCPGGPSALPPRPAGTDLA